METAMSLPKPTTAAERRRWQAEDEADAQAQIAATHARNDPRPDAFDQCVQSRYLTHRFDVEAVGGGRACRFCGRRFDDCARPA